MSRPGRDDRGREHVGGHDVVGDDGRLAHVGDAEAAPDVVAAFRRAGGRDRASRRLEDDRRQEAGAILGVGDADGARLGRSDRGDVSADPEQPGRTRRGERRRRGRDRDGLDRAREVDDAIRSVRGEPSVRRLPPLERSRVLVAHVGGRLVEGELAGGQARERGVGAIQAVGRVEPPEHVLRLGERSRCRAAVEVEGRDRPHHLDGVAHQSPAWSSADCTLARYALLV